MLSCKCGPEASDLQATGVAWSTCDIALFIWNLYIVFHLVQKPVYYSYVKNSAKITELQQQLKPKVF